MRWLPLAVLVSLARLGSAQPGATVGPCPDVEAYRSAIALHHSWQVKACLEEGNADCNEQGAVVARLTELMDRCRAGENVGPPPTQVAHPPPSTAAAAPGPAIIATFEAVGGGGLALASSSWRQSVGASPTLGARFGGSRGALGAMVSAEWTFEQLSSQTTIVPSPNNEQAMHRLRLLAHFTYEARPIPALAIGARAGVGVDYADARVNRAQNGAPFNDDESDNGLALELGAAAWWKVGQAVDVGGSLALPIAWHASTQAAIAFQYTSCDLELLVGIRVSSLR